MLSLLPGPEYGTNKNTLKGALDEAEHVADVHLTIKNRLLTEVQAQIKDWKNENYKKQMVGGCKETRTFEDEFHKVHSTQSNCTANTRTNFVCILSAVPGAWDSVREYVFFVFSDFKKHDFLRFFEMTLKKR